MLCSPYVLYTMIRGKALSYLMQAGVLQTRERDLKSFSDCRIRATARPTTTTNASKSTNTVTNSSFSSRVLLLLYYYILLTKAIVSS